MLNYKYMSTNINVLNITKIAIQIEYTNDSLFYNKCILLYFLKKLKKI